MMAVEMFRRLQVLLSFPNKINFSVNAFNKQSSAPTINIPAGTNSVKLSSLEWLIVAQLVKFTVLNGTQSSLMCTCLPLDLILR